MPANPRPHYAYLILGFLCLITFIALCNKYGWEWHYVKQGKAEALRH